MLMFGHKILMGKSEFDKIIMESNVTSLSINITLTEKINHILIFLMNISITFHFNLALTFGNNKIHFVNLILGRVNISGN